MMPHDTAVDTRLADLRLSKVLEEAALRMKAGRPVRWHRLIHTTLQIQLYASPDVASLAEMKWRLATVGIVTTVESTWLSFSP